MPNAEEWFAKAEAYRCKIEAIDAKHPGLLQRAEDAEFLYKKLDSLAAEMENSTVSQESLELLAKAKTAAMDEYDELRPVANARRSLYRRETNALREWSRHAKAFATP